MKNVTGVRVIITVLFVIMLLSGLNMGCRESAGVLQQVKTVPREAPWGIYRLDPGTQDVTLIYSFPADSYPSDLRLNNRGDRFVFAQRPNSSDESTTEIYAVGIYGKNLRRLTDNDYWDLYPVWSPDGARIAFLSRREKDLDIYVMDADGKNTLKLYDSGDHDADIDWVGNNIVFTSQFMLWIMNDDGTEPVPVTAYPERGKWGKANLPAGDYDPRLSPDGSKIAFERLVNTDDPHGGYDIFTVDRERQGEARLTNSTYSQGLVNWSHSGKELVYIVAAINGQGKYDIYIMNADGTNNRNITPDYFAADFLCHCPAFSRDDTAIYFLGQWWESE